MDLRFLSGNEYKIREVQSILTTAGAHVVPVDRKVHELQTQDVNELVKDKILKAFEIVGRPVFVEHTGLHLAGLNGFPAGLTQVFWDTLNADLFVTLVKGLSSRKVVARTTIGYCDGRRLHFFNGEISGTVPDAPAGMRDFQWDCVFVPSGYDVTFAEMGDAKNNISMRRVALDKFAAFLGSST